MIIHLQLSLVYNDTAHISCITTNYSAYKYNENVHPFWGTAFAASESNFSLSQPVKEAAAARCWPEPPPWLCSWSGKANAVPGREQRLRWVRGAPRPGHVLQRGRKCPRLQDGLSGGDTLCTGRTGGRCFEMQIAGGTREVTKQQESEEAATSNPAGAGTALAQLPAAFSAAKNQFGSPHSSAETASSRSAGSSHGAPAWRQSGHQTPSVTFGRPKVAGTTPHPPHPTMALCWGKCTLGLLHHHFTPGRAGVLPAPRRRAVHGGWLHPTAALNPVKAEWKLLG